MPIAIERQLDIPSYMPVGNQQISELKYINSNWDFIWGEYKKPKLNDELSKSLPKEWKSTANIIVNLKSMIHILDKNSIDTIQTINNNTQELANVSIDTMKKEYNNRIEYLEHLANCDDENSLNARATLYIAKNFDYEKQNQNIKTNSFISTILGTAQIINGIEKESTDIKYTEKITEENKENLNFFGRKILELKDKPQSKEDFIVDLKNHAKSNITKDEIVILCKMFDLPKPPSLLNNEHKKLIKESLKLAVAYEKTKDFDVSLKKEIQGVIDRKETLPKKEKEKEKIKNADLGIREI